MRSDPLNLIVRMSIRTLRAGGEVLCIVPQNHYEFWAAATRPRVANGLGLSIAECQLEVVRISRIFYLLQDSHNLLDEWQRLVAAYGCHGRVSYDARLVAAMSTHGLTRLLTLNPSDFARFSGLTLIDPTAGSPPAAPAGP